MGRRWRDGGVVVRLWPRGKDDGCYPDVGPGVVLPGYYRLRLQDYVYEY